MYIAVTTQPDIIFAAMWLGQYSFKLSQINFLAAKHILCYLAGTSILCLSIGSSTLLSTAFQGYMKIFGCADADWASDSHSEEHG